MNIITNVGIRTSVIGGYNVLYLYMVIFNYYYNYWGVIVVVVVVVLMVVWREKE